MAARQTHAGGSTRPTKKADAPVQMIEHIVYRPHTDDGEVEVARLEAQGYSVKSSSAYQAILEIPKSVVDERVNGISRPANSVRKTVEDGAPGEEEITVTVGSVDEAAIGSDVPVGDANDN